MELLIKDGKHVRNFLTPVTSLSKERFQVEEIPELGIEGKTENTWEEK